MDYAEEDDFSEWQEVHYSPPRTRFQTTRNDTIATPDSPILQPSHYHEPPASPPPLSSSSSSSDDFPVEDDCESATGSLLWPSRAVEIAKKRLGNSAIFLAVRRILCNYASRGRAFWSFGPAAGVVGAVLVVSLVYVRVVRWWRRDHEQKLNRLVLLLKEKDEKIRELMLQIARLNESLSSRRRVRVIRIA